MRVRSLAAEMLTRLGVEIDLDALVETLPVAHKQLVAICRALACDARLIIMDEPTTALTEREVRILLGIIRRLKADGVAVLFVSHKLAEVLDYDFIRRSISERVARGHIHLQETLADDVLRLMLEHPRVRAARVSTEKPDVYPDCDAVGCEVFGMKDGA